MLSLVRQSMSDVRLDMYMQWLAVVSSRPRGYLPSRRASPLFDRYQFIQSLVTEAHVCEKLAEYCYLTTENELATFESQLAGLML